MSRQVRDMIGKKFANRELFGGMTDANANKVGIQGFEMKDDDKLAYEEAMKKGDVKTMLSIKSGASHRKVQAEQFEAEFENFDIKTVSREHKQIDGVIEGLGKKYAEELDQAKADIEAKFEKEAEKLVKKGVGKGSIPHIILQDEYKKAIDTLEDGNRFKALRMEISELNQRKAQLDVMMDKFKEENKELIEQARQQMILGTLKELDLID